MDVLASPAGAGVAVSMRDREWADQLLARLLVPMEGTYWVAGYGYKATGTLDNEKAIADLPADYRACGVAMFAALQEGGSAAAHRVLMAHARENPALFAGFLCLDPGRYKSTWHLDELLDAEFPVKNFVLPDLLPVGLCAFAARPKIGKSWMAVQLAWSVATGSRFWDRTLSAGRVLYIALEDAPWRMQSRLKQQKAPKGANIWFEFDWPTFDKGGLVQLIEEIKRERFTFVVVDTLQRALGSIDTNKQAEMAVNLGLLQQTAMKNNMTIMLIDHHRKLGGLVEGDPIEDLLGATGKAGVLDTAWGLYRRRGEREAVLKITGRDVNENELSVRFDYDTGLWECLGNAADVVSGQQEAAVLEAISKLGSPSHQEIADTLQQDRANCFRRVQALVEKGQVRRIDGRPARFVVSASPPQGAVEQ